ncbi:MAG: type II toxin-antitoxin system Phd/YefM family antitoxin [Clostridia bacterium]|nr:type II toxin-antitoxin system Phd/YefM family antitoxin [Clostridia bacterium]
MIQIRPVSDLRNKFPEVETLVLKSNQPVYLTKNGYGSMVLLSLEQYSMLTENIEAKLDEADAAAQASSERLGDEEVFGSLKERVHGHKAV